MKLCPFCAEEIQDAAIVCKHCGRDLQPKTRGLPLAALGWLLCGVGVAMSAIFLLFFPTSVQVGAGEIGGQPIGAVNNLGLMADRQNGLIFFGLLAVLGAAAGIALRGRVMSKRTAVTLALVTAAVGSVAFQFIVGFQNLWVWFVLATAPSQ